MKCLERLSQCLHAGEDALAQLQAFHEELLEQRAWFSASEVLRAMASAAALRNDRALCEQFVRDRHARFPSLRSFEDLQRRGLVPGMSLDVVKVLEGRLFARMDRLAVGGASLAEFEALDAEVARSGYRYLRAMTLSFRIDCCLRENHPSCVQLAEVLCVVDPFPASFCTLAKALDQACLPERARWALGLARAHAEAIGDRETLDRLAGDSIDDEWNVDCTQFREALSEVQRQETLSEALPER